MDQTLWRIFADVFASPFFGTCIAAMAGAGFGAWGGQRLSERTHRAHELMHALRQANAIIVLASTVANEALSSKRHNVEPIADRYFEARKTAEAHNDAVLNGRNPEPKKFDAELIKVPALALPVDALNNIIFSATLIPGRALALVAMVQQSVNQMNHAICLRSELIDRFYASSPTPDVFCQDYFGLARADGNVNSMFHDSMISIMSYTDDVAFFGVELAEELESYGSKLRSALVKLRRDAPQVNSSDFSKARQAGLMPSRSKYEGWLKGFRNLDDVRSPNNSSKRTRKKTRAA